jgi:hypothetical protein
VRLCGRSRWRVAGVQNVFRAASGRLSGRLLRYRRHRRALVAGRRPPACFIFRQLAHFLRTRRHAVMTFALAIAFELFRGRRLRCASVSEHRNCGASDQCNQCCGLRYRALCRGHELSCRLHEPILRRGSAQPVWRWGIVRRVPGFYNHDFQVIDNRGLRGTVPLWYCLISECFWPAGAARKTGARPSMLFPRAD